MKYQKATNICDIQLILKNKSVYLYFCAYFLLNHGLISNQTISWKTKKTYCRDKLNLSLKNLIFVFIFNMTIHYFIIN